jgi:histidine triad (HIT) family protein
MNDPAVTDCIFCRITRGELGTEFVAESEHNVAFRDLHPQAPVHVLIVPRQHIAALRDVGSGDWHAQYGLHDGGYRVITNDGPDAGQTVPHLHFHLLGGGKLQAGLG